MTIKEVEARTGLSRSNVRYYEKEELIAPSRNERNGYRDYSEKDVENIKKIAYLRTLGISIEDIRDVISEKKALYEVIGHQNEILKDQILEFKKAKAMCEKMLTKKASATKNYRWNDTQKSCRTTGMRIGLFQTGFGQFFVHMGESAHLGRHYSIMPAVGILSYPKLPAKIPVQWSNGEATSLADKKWIFIYPVVCIVIRYLLKPFIYVKLQMKKYYGEIITEYLTNYLCFIALSAEVFSVLFVFQVVRSIAAVLAVDTAVLLGLLAVGLIKMDLRGKGM